MTKIVSIDGRKPPEPNGAIPEVVEILEHWLAQARNGNLIAVGLLCVARDGHVFTTSRGRDQRHTLVACCEYLKHDLCSDTA